MRKAKKMTSPIILLAILVSLFTGTIPSVQAAAVTGVILAVGLEAGSTGTLVATIIPANAINKEVTFSSSHPDIATVTGAQYDPATGTTRITVNAITAGNAVITATTADGNKTAVINITVFPPAQPQVPAASLSADGMVKPGRSFTVGVSLNNVTQSVYAEDVTLAYDSDLFDYVGAAGAGSSIQIVTEEKAAAGKVRLIAANIGGVSGASTTVLKLTFKVKAGVQNTIGTIAVTQAKLGVAPEGTVIQAALGSKSIAVGSLEPIVDKTALITAITNAQGLYDAAVVGTLPGQYPQAAKDAFGVAINTAKAVKDNSSSTQAQVDSALTTLGSAVETFKTAVIKEVSADLNKDGSIDVGDLAMVAYHYGKNSAGTDWQTAKMVDMNGDDMIDITDLAYVASRILE